MILSPGYSFLGEETLKSGEKLRVGCVLGPCLEYVERLVSFLGHKGGLWVWHIEKALKEPLEGLESRFYIGEIGDTLVGNICTFESASVGILGHVFTHPGHRRKGICQALMRGVMEDFRRRGGKILTLSTGYDSPAYHIYASFGFRSIQPGSGVMRYDADPSFSSHYFDPQPATPRPVRWGDGGPVSVLGVELERPHLRSVALRIFQPGIFEHESLHLMKALEEGTCASARVLETPDGRVVGLGTCFRDPIWPSVWLVDLWCHPNFLDYQGDLFSSLEIPLGRAWAFLEEVTPSLKEVLQQRGFVFEGTLHRHLLTGEISRDLQVWGCFREPSF